MTRPQGAPPRAASPRARAAGPTALAALALAAFAALANTAPAGEAGTAKVDALLRLVQQRLELAPRMAEAKWNAKVPIEQPAQESKLLERIERLAADERVDPALARGFFEAQLDAGKLMQRERHKAWARERRAEIPGAPDLQKEIEPTLSRLDPAMLRALREAEPVLRGSGGRELLDARSADLIRLGGLDFAAGPLALKPLYELANRP